ncbi:hypothetical protein D3C72_1095060 [compost metagenome]
MGFPQAALVSDGQHLVEIIGIAARLRRRRSQVAIIVEQQAVLRRDGQGPAGRQRAGRAVQSQVQRFQGAAFERAVHQLRHAKADADGTLVGGAALRYAALRHAIAVHGQAHAQAHVRGWPLDHDHLPRCAHLAAVARLRQRLRYQRVGADVDAHAFGQQGIGFQVGEHRVFRTLPRGPDGEAGIAARRQTGVFAHGFDEGGALCRRDGCRVVDRFDGRELAHDIEAGHVIVELAARQMLAGAKQGFEAAQQVGIAFYARDQAVLGTMREIVETLFGVVIDCARRARIQGAAHRQGQQQAARPYPDT